MNTVGFQPVGLIADVLFSLRSLRKSPGFTATALITLVLGIGATTAMYSIVYAVLFRPLPYRNPESLVHIFSDDSSDSRSGVPYLLYDVLRERSQTIKQSVIYYRNTGLSRVIVGGRNEPESVQAGFSSAGLAELVGIGPVLGRFFDDGEVKRGEPVAVISRVLWQRRFGGGADALGKALDIDNKFLTVIGVMPGEFQLPARETQIWLPITSNRYWLERPPRDDQHSRGFFMRWNIIGRLHPEATVVQSQTELNGLANRLAVQDKSWNMGLPVKVLPMSIEINEKRKLALAVLLGAVMLVLLMACANVANLLLARGAERSKELSIRLALGASRSRIVQQILTESLLLASVAAGAAILLANWTIPLLIRWAPADLPRMEQVKMDLAVLGFAIAVSLLTAILFGLGPALKAAQNDPQNGLRGGRSRDRGESKASALLIVVEFSFAVVLATSAGLLLRSLWETDRVDLGFQPAQVLAMRLQPSAEVPQSRRDALFDRVRERIQLIPGVESVGGIRSLFELGAAPTNSLRAVEGQSAELNTDRPLTWTTVSGDYFQAMGIPLFVGRLFSEYDGKTSNLVAIIDESMAGRYWPNQNPIGKRFKGQDRRGQNDDWITIVGVVRDARRQGVERESTPHVFLWHRQSEPAGDWVIRISGPPEAVVSSVRAVVREIDPRTVIANLMPLEEHLVLQTRERRFQTWLLTLFAGLALVLAPVGIFGVMSHAAARRTHEIGIRMALGADRMNVIQMILRHGVGLAATGLVLGIVLAAGATRLLSGLLYGVTATDSATFAAAGLLLLLVASIATLAPAWRASRIDPIVALRRD